MKEFERLQVENRSETRRKRIQDTVRLAQHNLRVNFPEARAFDRRQHPGQD